tara:strand:+ start:114 stop:230 length:117 start_codon:yes stop_codon:yes gene_type:complete
MPVAGAFVAVQLDLDEFKQQRNLTLKALLGHFCHLMHI